MICAESVKFKHIERGYEDNLVLIPGWASDCRIFNTLNMKFNYIIPDSFSPSSFGSGLRKALDEGGIGKISLLGWSMGGFLAQEFAMKNPELVEDLILVSVRRRYETDGLNEIRGYLKRSRKGYLYKFYSQCFYSGEEATIFKRTLLKEYLKGMDLERLLETLDYLERAGIDTGFLKIMKGVKIVHGADDRIAPFKEAVDIKNELPDAKFIPIKECGHIPFLRKGFAEEIS